jgi:hypothetical protein
MKPPLSGSGSAKRYTTAMRVGVAANASTNRACPGGVGDEKTVLTGPSGGGGVDRERLTARDDPHRLLARQLPMAPPYETAG